MSHSPANRSPRNFRGDLNKSRYSPEWKWIITKNDNKINYLIALLKDIKISQKLYKYLIQVLQYLHGNYAEKIGCCDCPIWNHCWINNNQSTDY